MLGVFDGVEWWLYRLTSGKRLTPKHAVTGSISCFCNSQTHTHTCIYTFSRVYSGCNRLAMNTVDREHSTTERKQQNCLVWEHRPYNIAIIIAYCTRQTDDDDYYGETYANTQLKNSEHIPCKCFETKHRPGSIWNTQSYTHVAAWASAQYYHQHRTGKRII